MRWNKKLPIIIIIIIAIIIIITVLLKSIYTRQNCKIYRKYR